jgi:hypothetical protein
MDIDLNARVRFEYENSFVAFLDVLGFKSLVLSNKKDDKEKLEAYFGLIYSALQYLKRIPSKKDIHALTISDSVIFSMPHGRDANENLDRLRHLCVAAGIIQQSLAMKGMWLRGAISSGRSYFDSTRGQIIGPAYINAYLLEKNAAVWPRIVLDSKIIGALKYDSAASFIDAINMAKTGGLHFSNWGSTLLYQWNNPDADRYGMIDHDVALFIDYLSPIVERQDGALLSLIRTIESNMYLDSEVYRKMRWVVDYLRALRAREIKKNNFFTLEVIDRLDKL